MATILAVTLILSSAFAIAAGQGARWKLLNLLTILLCTSLGFGLGYAAGLGSKNMGFVPHAGVPLAMIFGIAAALACVGRNITRARQD
jgi:4-hydroxybenzoate polyprenyltransferase